MSKSPTKRGLEFPDPKDHIGKKEMCKRLHSVLIDLRRHVPAGELHRQLIEFSNLINPGSFFDAGRLPVASDDGRCRSSKAACCLMARISQIIMQFWRYRLEIGDPIPTIEDIEASVAELETINRIGLAKCWVRGDEKTGYDLTLPVPDEPESEKYCSCLSVEFNDGPKECVSSIVPQPDPNCDKCGGSGYVEEEPDGDE